MSCEEKTKALLKIIHPTNKSIELVDAAYVTLVEKELEIARHEIKNLKNKLFREYVQSPKPHTHLDTRHYTRLPMHVIDELVRQEITYMSPEVYEESGGVYEDEEHELENYKL
jgi:hypothetical protein